MDYFKKLIGRETEHEENPAVESEEGGFLRDWEDFQDGENSWSSWNPLSSAPTPSNQPGLTPQERRNWRLFFGGGLVGFVLAFYFMFPESGDSSGSFSLLVSTSTCLCVAGLASHPTRREEILKAERLPGLLVLLLATPSLLYASFVKQSLMALWGTVLAIVVALVYLFLSSDKSSNSMASSLVFGVGEILKATFGAAQGCVNMIRNRG
eukprot:TRINITY_DN13404_c0_g1_i1.p1 TRINITY_DN13404_c0_g1~~TRINITY_DN13404_c0_g1_i1.p1  ORF type:complete len:209 (-),score=30.15 TRINITY_DN13404_c0_g1_i1:394-1020(-)